MIGTVDAGKPIWTVASTTVCSRMSLVTASSRRNSATRTVSAEPTRRPVRPTGAASRVVAGRGPTAVIGSVLPEGASTGADAGARPFSSVPTRAGRRLDVMDYRGLGRTGMQVSPLCLGAMMFGEWGEPDHDTSIRIIHRALDAGINFIDTADVYSLGESEVIVGKALAGGKRDDVILATKFHGPMD